MSGERISRLTAFGVLWFVTSVAGQNVPATGIAVPGMASYDALASSLMTTYHIPGGAIAVARNRKLIFARGYGYADTSTHSPVQPDSLFRIASLTKPITSAAIMTLVEQGRLDLDTKVFSILTQYQPLPQNADPRLQTVTIRDLLDHSGGWNRDTTFDPMFMSTQIATSLGAPAPAGPDAIIRYMLDKPLQFDPGQQYDYSNFGYCLLGRVIEKITGMPYAQFVQEAILAPANITCMRIGHSLQSIRVPNEVRYYDYPGAALTASVYGTGEVPSPDGGFYLEAMDSHGAWIASTVEYLRFVTALPDLLSPAAIQTMTARPPAPLWSGQSAWYAFGWMVRPAGNDFNWWHTGALPGTATIVVRAFNGMAWAAFFNSRPANDNAFFSDLDNGMWNALAGVTSWPDADQFDSFKGCQNTVRQRPSSH